MSQVFEVSRILSDNNAAVANTSQPLENPLSRGMDPAMRIDYLDFTIVGTMTAGGLGSGTLGFIDKANRDQFLDAILSNIRLYSSSVNETIRNLSLSELCQSISFLNSDFIQSNLPRPGQIMNYADGNPFRLSVSCPWRLANPALQAMYCARAGQYADGGLTYTTGSLTFTPADGQARTISCSIEARMRGPISAQEVKSSPLCYEKYTTSGISEFPSGLYASLQNFTDSPDSAYAGAGGASAGYRVSIDGVDVINMLDFDPISRTAAMADASADPSAFDLDTQFEGTTGTGSNTFLWGRAGIPIFYTSLRDLSFNLPVVNKRLVVESGANITTTNCDYLAVRVRRLSEISDSPRCGASIGNPVVIGNPQGPTSAMTVPFAPEGEA